MLPALTRSWKHPLAPVAALGAHETPACRLLLATVATPGTLIASQAARFSRDLKGLFAAAFAENLWKNDLRFSPMIAVETAGLFVRPGNDGGRRRTCHASAAASTVFGIAHRPTVTVVAEGNAMPAGRAQRGVAVLARFGRETCAGRQVP